MSTLPQIELIHFPGDVEPMAVFVRQVTWRDTAPAMPFGFAEERVSFEKPGEYAGGKLGEIEPPVDPAAPPVEALLPPGQWWPPFTAFPAPQPVPGIPPARDPGSPVPHPVQPPTGLPPIVLCCDSGTPVTVVSPPPVVEAPAPVPLPAAGLLLGAAVLTACVASMIFGRKPS